VADLRAHAANTLVRLPDAEALSLVLEDGGAGPRFLEIDEIAPAFTTLDNSPSKQKTFARWIISLSFS
jgi:hypothetical protein